MLPVIVIGFRLKCFFFTPNVFATLCIGTADFQDIVHIASDILYFVRYLSYGSLILKLHFNHGFNTYDARFCSNLRATTGKKTQFAQIYWC